MGWFEDTTNRTNFNDVTVADFTAGNLVIDAAELADGSIETAKIAANAVTGGKITANTITGGLLAVATITATELTSNAITAVKIAAGVIPETKLDGAFVTGTTSATPGNDTTHAHGLSAAPSVVFITPIETADGTSAAVVLAKMRGLGGGTAPDGTNIYVRSSGVAQLFSAYCLV